MEEMSTTELKHLSSRSRAKRAVFHRTLSKPFVVLFECIFVLFSSLPLAACSR